MALRPGHVVQLKSTPPPRTAPTDTGVLFLAGMTEKGDNTQVLTLRSMGDYTALLGNRISYGVAYDSLETFFREGGSRCYFSRVVGPNPVRASVTIKDASAVNTIILTAEGPGTWGLGLRVQVVAGVQTNSINIVIVDSTGAVIEQSYDILLKADVITWANSYSNYVNAADTGTGGLPAVAALAPLTGSATGDETNATETQWLNAINLFSPVLGPGQVAMAGRTTDTAHTNLLAHALANNRFALCDLADTSVVATMTASSLVARASGNGQYGAAFAPWVTIPGLTAGTVRVVPPSALAAGLIARGDANGDPDDAPAGNNGISNIALGVDFSYTDAQRDTLNTNGVCIFRFLLGGVRLYGIRTMTDPVNNALWAQFPQARLVMAILAKVNNVLEAHLFSKVDGAHVEFGKLGGDITGELLPYYASNSLYGDSAADAFQVNVGSGVNTPTTIAANELHAQISLRVSPGAELIVVDLIKVAINQSL